MTLEWASVKQEKYIHHKNTEKLDLIKIKNLYFLRDTIKTVRRKATKLEETFATHTHTHTG